MQLPAAPVKRSSDWVLQLINIVFLLLLFFLVNGTIAGQQESQIEPPKSVLVTSGNPPGDAIYIDTAGAIKYRGNSVSAAQVAALLRSGPAADADALPGIKVVADRRLKAAQLVETLRQFRRLGFSDISLITIRENIQ
jgi:biopolymer transport protein ExbD